MTDDGAAGPPDAIGSRFSGLPTESSAADHAAEILRAAVGAAVLTSMHCYGIGSIAERMGIQPEVLRAGVRIAMSEGVVSSIGDDSFHVAERSQDGLRDLLRLRVPLEAAAARKAASHELSSQQITVLRDLALATAAPAETGDFLGYINADLAFHLHVMLLAGPPELVEIVRVLRARSQLQALDQHDGDSFMSVNVQEHIDLVAHIERGDASAAGDLVRIHINRASDLWRPPM